MIQLSLKRILSHMAPAFGGVGQTTRMTCKACTCHKCLGHATEFELLKKKVAQVTKLQDDLQKLRNTGKQLADEVANLQILCRVRGRETPDDTISYPEAKRAKQPILLD